MPTEKCPRCDGWIKMLYFNDRVAANKQIYSGLKYCASCDFLVSEETVIHLKDLEKTNGMRCNLPHSEERVLAVFDKNYVNCKNCLRSMVAGK